jgi:hypothetical protein
VVDLDGGGTSAATPQAAAAAALWLSYHRAEIERAGHWNDWQKAEATYVAMLKSAQRDWTQATSGETADVHLGAGILKASRMLDVSFEEARHTCGTTLTFPSHDSTGAFRDKLNGASGATSILLGAYSLAKPWEMVDARLGPTTVRRSTDQRDAALDDLFFNELLSREWLWGRQPRKKEVHESWTKRIHKWFRKDEAELDAEARRMRERYTRGGRKVGRQASGTEG